MKGCAGSAVGENMNRDWFNLLMFTKYIYILSSFIELLIFIGCHSLVLARFKKLLSCYSGCPRLQLLTVIVEIIAVLTF